MNPQDVINGYRIIKPIGAGGAGYLYHAQKEGLEVCIKECRFGLRADDPEALDVVRLFEREVSTLRDLNHPGIPKYYDSFSANDGGEERLYLAMELVQGKNLADLLADKRISLDYVLKVAQEIAETLLYTHAFVPPIIHRDIKPENIIQPDADGSRVKLVDFGSVTGAVLKKTMATHNTIAGTPGYAAPEIWHGKECPATDIYSLGATLLYLLSAGRTPGEFLNDDLRLDFKGKLNGTPPWLEQLVHEMTEPNVTRRVKNAGELLGRLYGRQKVDVEIAAMTKPTESETAPKNSNEPESINVRINYEEFKKERELSWKQQETKDISRIENSIEQAINPFRAIADDFGRNFKLVESQYRITIYGSEALIPTKDEVISFLEDEPSAIVKTILWRYASPHWRLNCGYCPGPEFSCVKLKDSSKIYNDRVGILVDQIKNISPQEYAKLITAVNQGVDAFISAITPEKEPSFLKRLFERKTAKQLKL